ncbi:hypothetical protein [Nocardia sp. NPDC050793]|uniref:hypothetical protein n=1 Tax=Nocardia sp. NPDC050793 TaxID=3155159 RepID=UPI0033DC1ECA
MAAHRAHQVLPEELRRRRRWVGWTRDKMPIQPDGTPASSVDPETWTSWTVIRSSGRRGFVLGDGVGCIDLDHCLVDGVPTPAAAALLAELPPTYIEISPSGEGLHIWGRRREKPGRRFVTADGLSVEIYSVGRYITVTSRPYPGSVSHLADLPELR